MKEASEIGLPVVRHPYVHYPDDPEVLNLGYQFMVGTGLWWRRCWIPARIP